MFIPDPDLDFLPIPDPVVNAAPDPGSATLQYNMRSTKAVSAQSCNNNERELTCNGLTNVKTDEH
jgi:hypothetical protein